MQVTVHMYISIYPSIRSIFLSIYIYFYIYMYTCWTVYIYTLDIHVYIYIYTYIHLDIHGNPKCIWLTHKVLNRSWSWMHIQVRQVCSGGCYGAVGTWECQTVAKKMVDEYPFRLISLLQATLHIPKWIQPYHPENLGYDLWLKDA